MIFKDNHRPDCLVMAVVNLAEIDERCTRSTGIAEAPVVAVIGILPAIGAGQKPVVTIQTVGTIECSGDRDRDREALGKPDARQDLEVSQMPAADSPQNQMPAAPLRVIRFPSYAKPWLSSVPGKTSPFAAPCRLSQANPAMRTSRSDTPLPSATVVDLIGGWRKKNHQAACVLCTQVSENAYQYFLTEKMVGFIDKRQNNWYCIIPKVGLYLCEQVARVADLSHAVSAAHKGGEGCI